MNDKTLKDNAGKEVVSKPRSQQIAVTEFGVSFQNAGDMIAFANMMASAEMAVPKAFRGNPGMCLKLVDDAIRFNMSPFSLASGAYVVNDRVAYEAKILSAVVLANAAIQDRPDYIYEGEGDTLRCEVVFTTTTGKKVSYKTPPLANITPKNSPLWKTDPEQQLAYYAVRAAARRHFPDVLAGVYDPDEAAAARARNVTPETSGLADRLSGAKEGGFSQEHVEKEVASVAAAEDVEDAEVVDEPAEDAKEENAAADEPAEEGEKTDGKTADDDEFLAEIDQMLADAGTELEVAAVTEMVGAYVFSSDDAAKAAQEKIATKAASLEKPKKK